MSKIHEFMCGLRIRLLGFQCLVSSYKVCTCLYVKIISYIPLYIHIYMCKEIFKRDTGLKIGTFCGCLLCPA